MSESAAQAGKDIAPERLYNGVEAFLCDAERVLTVEVIESFTAFDWAVLISHSNRHGLEPRDVLMEVVSQGMSRSASIVANLKNKQDADAKNRLRSTLQLVK
ncbi:MAG: hypothetical protein CMI01_18785 [Oceanospirillaceae bacterium]|nr:hypothetical protein [Oceanospirillaceae bacterium]